MPEQVAPLSIPSDWRRALAGVGYGPEQLNELFRRTEVLHHSDDRVRPERSMVFRAFRETRVREVRVVILGEDPYPEPGKADGLAFSIRTGRRVDGSLKRVFDNLGADDRVRFRIPVSGDLGDWARRGVLLLNSALTVEPDQKKDVNKANKRRHAEHWREFVKHVLQAVLAQRRRVVFLLWGDHAVETFESARGTEWTRHIALDAAHPSGFNRPGRKTRRTPFDDSRHFSEANDWLRCRRIDWTLPGPYLHE